VAIKDRLALREAKEEARRETFALGQFTKAMRNDPPMAAE